jgi:hypothetical protein
MNRYDTVNAYAALIALHQSTWRTDATQRLMLRLSKPLVRELVDVHQPYGRYPERGDVLDALTPEAFAGYFQLVKRHLGESEAIRLSDEWARINDPAGVEIIVQNSDVDPTRINFHVSDPIANEWAEKHGSLDGGTWECADGPEFIYDSTYWHPGIFDELRKEGYVFDFSEYGEPDEHDLEVARHASECTECQYDWHAGEEHLKAGIEEVATKKLAQG